MIIPATPAKTEKPRIGYEAVGCIGSDVVVIRCRMCGEQHRVSRQRFEAGEYDVPTADASASHLADEWRRLREEKQRAEETLRGRGKEQGVGWITTIMFDEWVAATKALATFEAANGIGGGA